MAAEEWYHEFVDKSHTPSKDDIICHFYYDAGRGISTEECVGRVASESSVGTWTTLSKLPDRLQRLKGIGFEYDDHHIKVSYPKELWEPGNMPQLLSGVAGNIFGMKAVKHLRLLDMSLPPWFLRSFKGPQFGIKGIRDVFRVKKRPLTATVPKPKLGYSSKEHAEIGYDVWLGGVDLIKDDENLTSQGFNKFKDRITRMAKLRDKAEKKTGERKGALLNITAETKEMEKRAAMLADLGWEYAMVDVVTVGPAAVQTVRDVCEEHGLAIHAHRAMHAMFTKDLRHGMAMPALVKIMRTIGVDNIHVGTVIGKLESPKEEVEANIKQCRDKKIEAGGWLLDQDWGGTKPVWPVPSGGLHPGLVPEIVEMFGPDMIIQAGGGVLGHPDGATAGGHALRGAIDAALEGVTLKEAAKTDKVLAKAVEKWGKTRPK
ncbi:MAG: type III ribulose-bisphosphate carboxylase [Euryarchaeota archaeon]|nr:type III ribulose-bisphosphate carboxylase [Euryarchaeota archaeon]